MKQSVVVFILAGFFLVATTGNASQQPTTDETVPRVFAYEYTRVTERVSLLERDVEYLGENIMKLHDELRLQTAEIKILVQQQDRQMERWIVFVVGLLVAGDRAWLIVQRAKSNAKEG